MLVIQKLFGFCFASAILSIKAACAAVVVSPLNRKSKYFPLWTALFANHFHPSCIDMYIQLLRSFVTMAGCLIWSRSEHGWVCELCLSVVIVISDFINNLRKRNRQSFWRNFDLAYLSEFFVCLGLCSHHLADVMHMMRQPKA